MGSPTMRSWPEGIRLAAQMNFRYPQFVSTPLQQLIPNASPEGLTLMQDLMKYDPLQRPTASQTLQYPFFQVNNALPPPTNTAEPQVSTYTRRPPAKSEYETRLEENNAAKLAEEALNEQKYSAPQLNVLHDEAEPTRLESTYAMKRLAGKLIFIYLNYLFLIFYQ